MNEPNWGRLFHAYGLATDTPAHLLNLSSKDEQCRKEAVLHLLNTVIHQGTIYPATPAVMRWITELLRDTSQRTSCKSEIPCLGQILSFIGYAGESLNEIYLPKDISIPTEEELDEFFLLFAEDEEGEDVWCSPLIDFLMIRGIRELGAMGDEVLEAIIPFVKEENRGLQAAAVDAVGEWAFAIEQGIQYQAAHEAIKEKLAGAKSRDERAGLVLAMGRMGGDVSEYLVDPDKAVQACAALFVASPLADSILISALCYPDQIEEWFDLCPHYFNDKIRYFLLGRLISRKVTIEQMLPAALAVMAVSTAMCADHDWGRILKVTFPEAVYSPGCPPALADKLTKAQREVLLAMVANQELWNPRSGNARIARLAVGLPNDRDEVAAYIRSTPVTDA